MGNIFDYARNKIKSKYSSRYDYSFEDVKRKEAFDIYYIDQCEEDAKENFKKAISCRVKALWYTFNDDEKLFVGTGIVVCAFVMVIFLLGIKNVPLNILVLNSAEFFFSCFIISGVLFLYHLIRKKLIKSRGFYIVWAAFLLLSVPHIPVLCGYETTQIGDFYEAREYTEKYYVLMSREPETTKNRKCYTLPAEIERRSDYLYTTDVYEDYYFQEHGGDDVYALVYHINRLYFPNGGYLTFDYDAAYDNPEYSRVYLNKETKVTDYYDDYYYITLTNRKVE